MAIARPRELFMTGSRATSSERYPGHDSSRRSSPCVSPTASTTFSASSSTVFSRHGRFPSSSSSLSSSPIGLESSESFTLRKSPGGLPDLTEDPREFDSRFESSPPDTRSSPWRSKRWSEDLPRQQTRTAHVRRSVDDYDRPSASYPLSKRRRSGDNTWSTITSSVRSTLGSMSRRSRSTRRAVSTGQQYWASPPPSPLPYGSRPASRATSINKSNEKDVMQIRTIEEDTQMEFDSVDAAGNELHEQRRPTPLLPAFVDHVPEEVISPLHPPSIALSRHTSQETLSSRAKWYGLPTPPLSTRPSVASFGRSRASASVPFDLPSFDGEDDDPWADSLGHNNFTIYPQPYVPEQSDAQSCDQLIRDWQTARSEFAKHLSRTELYFGTESRVYRLTEEKWTAIDAKWKDCSDRVSRRGLLSGELSDAHLAEPAPMPIIPQLVDARLVQNEHIVGPMEVAPPLIQPAKSTKSKAEQLLSLIIPARLSKALGN